MSTKFCLPRLPTAHLLLKLPQSIDSASEHITLHISQLNLNPDYLCAKLLFMDFIEVLGLTAGSCTTIAFLPQVIKTWKSRSAKDLSLGMFSFFCFGVLLWLIYGIFQHDVPVIAANLVTLLLASTLLFFKLRFKE